MLLPFTASAETSAETFRVATFSPELTRKGPGLLLRDILTEKDPQVEAAARVIAGAAPDVILLTGFDYDMDGVALTAFAARIRASGIDYPYRLALRPNTGMAIGLDLDGDGESGGPGDAQGFGRFAGAGGMALLSRLPLGAATDYSAFPWRALPGNLMEGAGLSPQAAEVQRLSSTGHWSVPVTLPDGTVLTLLAWMATAPVFDGAEDRNGRRNHDEAAFWLRLLDGALPFAVPPAPFVLLGNANLDPVDGDGRAEALRSLLSDPRLQDPRPASPGAVAAALAQGGANAAQAGDPALDTADWPDDGGPGNLRVDYVLPSSGLVVRDAAVWWPEPGAATDPAALASRHRLVHVDVALR